MTFETAKAIIDYKVNAWLSNHNNSAKITKLIGFYGGEPLLNIALIKQVVSYAKSLENIHDLKFKFNMTTNGVLLDKYISYLIENNFLISLSLDGNNFHNQYRVFGNNAPSFAKVVKNILDIKKKHSNYFQNNVIFNTVLHDKSNRNEVVDFFVKTFGKRPVMSELSELYKRGEIESMLYKDNQITSDDNSSNKFFLRNDSTKLFLLDIFSAHYALSSVNWKNTFTTGTCIPFSKKIFITAKGVIMMCERIAHEFALGEIKENRSININFEKAAEIFNHSLNERAYSCKHCYEQTSCSECVFMLETRLCPKFATKEKYKSQLIHKIQYYEHSVPSVKDGEHWFFLHQFVYFINKQNNVIVYNELNHSLIEHNITDTVLLDVIRRLNSTTDETHIIELNQPELDNNAVKIFIEDIRNNFSGDVVKKVSKTKPFIRRPSMHIINDVEYTHVDDEYILSYRLKLSVTEVTINTGLNDESNNHHVFKSAGSRPSKYEIYNYLDSIAKQISEYRQIQQINIVCYRDSLLYKLKKFIKSIEPDVHSCICIHSEIDIAENVINRLGNEFTYYIYLKPSEDNFELLSKLCLLNESVTIIPFVQVKDNADINNLDYLSSKYSVEFNIYPVFVKNSTILNHFIKSKEYIIEQKLSVKDININGIINKNIFGKVYINEQGEISAMGLKESSFNIKHHSILDFVYDQLKHKKEWFLIRSSVPKCKDCIFHNLCPPISKYEMFLNKYDLCNIN
jgi:uncharacterized protein